MRAIEPQHSDVIAEETSPFRRCVSAAVQVSMTIGHAPLTLAGEHVVAPADLNNVRWVSHCRDLVRLPVAA